MPSGPDRLGAGGAPLFYPIADAETPPAAPQIRAGRGDSVRVCVRSLSVMQKEAVVRSARTGAAWRLASDEGAYLDGHDAAPCPLSFFSVGMVSSYMEEILALAAARGIALRDPVLTQDNFYTMKGSALKGTMTGGARDVELALSAETDADADALRLLAQDAVAAAPIHGLLRGAQDSLFSLTHNGAQIPAGKAKPVDAPVPADPDGAFQAAQPAPGDWSGLIRKAGPSPKTEETTTLAGGSLTDHQDRVLHLRVICRIGEDGVKRIEQQLFNPHGSIFHYRCEEAPEGGGHGRAPDAASYLAAGIGFCFMTQLGRYAKIVKTDLRAYRIVQDLHLSLGGASGGTGRAGQADPVETHVFLESGEDDDFARACLDMSEQTCFLHAFCRTDLKVRVKVAARAPERA